MYVSFKQCKRPCHVGDSAITSGCGGGKIHVCQLCRFDSEITAKNQQQAALTRERLKLEKDQKKLQKQQERKVGSIRQK